MKLIRRVNILILFFLLVAGTYVLINRVIWQNLYLFSNSDFLYLPSLSRNLSEGIYNWRQWVLPPAPSFFPDMFIYILISLMTKNIVISSVFYGVVISIFFIVSTTSIFMIAEEYFKYGKIFLAVTLGYSLWFFIISFYPEDIGLFLIPSYHSSATLFSIILYSLIKKSKKRYIYLFIIVSTLAVISDKQIIYTFYLPFLVTSLIMRKGSEKNYFLWSLLYFIISFIIAWFILKLLVVMEIFQIPTLPIWQEIKKNIFEWKVFTNIYSTIPDVKEFFIDFYTDKFILFLLFLYAIGLNIYYSLPISKAKFEIRFISQCIILVYVFSFVSQMFFGVWGGFRYMWGIYLFPYLSILLYGGNNLSQMLLEKEFRNVGQIQHFFILIARNKAGVQRLFMGITLFFLVICGYFFILNSIKKISTQVPYPPFLSCLDTVKEKYNLTYGLSDYWNAKHIRYLSQRNLIVNQVYTNLERYNWVHNQDWYKKDIKGNPIRYNFLIPERLDRNIIENRFGKPERLETCEGKEIFIYPRGFSF